MTQSKTPICRNISLKLKDYFDKDVIPAAIPSDECLTSEFLNQILPKQKIEHLGRQKIIKLSPSLSVSSLFFQTVHSAFENHYPFAIKPETLMYLIVHEIAITINKHPQHYRDLFSTSTERQTIKIRHDDLILGNPNSPWNDTLESLNQLLSQKVPSSIADHLLVNFSTSTPETKAASIVAFMDTASPFYDYRVMTMCGLPEIRLLGTPDDYHKLLVAATNLAKYFEKHLNLYFKHLLPVLETLEKQAKGEPLDEEFWKSTYKYASQSGGDVFNGWLSAFINYIQTPEVQAGPYWPASKGGIVQKPANLFDWTKTEGGLGMIGLKPSSIMSHISKVSFVWNYLDTELPMTFIGGMLGIDNQDGYLTPTLSYGVLHNTK